MTKQLELIHIPEDVLKYIFKFFEQGDLNRIKQVCKQFLRLANDPQVQEICFKNTVKKKFRETLSEQYYRIEKIVEKVVEDNDLLHRASIDQESAADQYIDIVIESYRDENKTLDTKSGMADLEKIQRSISQQKTIEDQSKSFFISRLINNRSTKIFISFIPVLIFGGLFIDKNFAKNFNYSESASTSIDAFLGVSTLIFFVTLMSVLIGKCYKDELKETQKKVVALDEASPLLKFQFFPKKLIEEKNMDNAVESLNVQTNQSLANPKNN